MLKSGRWELHTTSFSLEKKEKKETKGGGEGLQYVSRTSYVPETPSSSLAARVFSAIASGSPSIMTQIRRHLLATSPTSFQAQSGTGTCPGSPPPPSQLLGLIRPRATDPARLHFTPRTGTQRKVTATRRLVGFTIEIHCSCHRRVPITQQIYSSIQ
ncbi:hypothetical protein LZ30DRAFT_35819 [Colletotrichum cereale]|nr:hypothetical protein LZ30DRAFT_35819 [Colletotrichum cereale]